MSAAAHPMPEKSTPLGSRSKLELVGRSPAVDLVRAERAVAELLAALGQDPTSEQLAETPRRVAASYAELLTPAPFTLTTFPNDEGYDELVLAKAIPFSSLCQHHLLPFVGVAHVGYLPADRILGLSKLARVVERFARRLQLQERLTTQVADWLQDQLAPKGVGVVLEAEHLCMTLRGVAGGRGPHRHLDPARPAARRPALPPGVPRPHGNPSHLLNRQEHPMSTTSTPTFVIVGAGLAGAKAAETLRAEGFDGRLLLLGEEAERPYERPPLSKAYLRGETDRDSLYVHPEELLRRPRHRAAPLDPGPLDRPGRPSARARRPASASATSGCCWPPARHRVGCACPGRSWTASTTCAPASDADTPRRRRGSGRSTLWWWGPAGSAARPPPPCASSAGRSP